MFYYIRSEKSLHSSHIRDTYIHKSPIHTLVNLDRLPVNERLAQCDWWILEPVLFAPLMRKQGIICSCIAGLQWRSGIRWNSFNSWQAMIGWLLQQRWPRRRLLSLIVCQATVYRIWRERNDRKHGRSPTRPLAIFNKIDRVTKDILLADGATRGVQPYSPCSSSIAKLS